MEALECSRALSFSARCSELKCNGIVGRTPAGFSARPQQQGASRSVRKISLALERKGARELAPGFVNSRVRASKSTAGENPILCSGVQGCRAHGGDGDHHIEYIGVRSISRSFVLFSPMRSIPGGRRWSGALRNGRSSLVRRVFPGSAASSLAVEEVEVGTGSDEKTADTTTKATEGTPLGGVAPQVKGERFKPRVPGQKARRESPTVPAEALIPGAVFTGSVSTIQPFGAFVNFGAFTDGLVHISKLSNSYVTNVSDIVTIGQEVKVTILSVEQTSGRIALSMVEGIDDSGNGQSRQAGGRVQQGPDGRPLNRGRTAGAGAGSRQPKRDEPKKPPTKLVKGQEVEGTVKNKIRSGVFVEIPDEDDGFLRFSDIPGGENMSQDSFMQIGQKVKATVLKIDRGKIVLTMKTTVDISSINRDINKGLNVGATNPFEIAFRAFNMIPDAAKESDPVVGEPVAVGEAVPEDTPPVEEEAILPEASAIIDEASVVEEENVQEVAAEVDEAPVIEQEVPAEVDEIPVVSDGLVSEPTSTSAILEDTSASTTIPSLEDSLASSTIPSLEDTLDSSTIPSLEASVASSTTSVLENASASLNTSVLAEEASNAFTTSVSDEGIVPEMSVAGDTVPESKAESVDTSVTEEVLVPETLPETIAEAVTSVEEAADAVDEVTKQMSAFVDEVAEETIAETSTATEESPAPVEVEVPEPASAMGNDSMAADEFPSLVEDVIPEPTNVAEAVPEEISEVAETVDTEAVNEVNAEAKIVEPALETPVETKPEKVSAALVKELRDETGAGMMDCKRALAETGGDIEKAREFLRKKGLASAGKKANRIASEGLIGSYIHDSRIGVLVELNCETDFVSRGQAFKSLVEDVAMQVVASQQVQFVSVDDVSADVVNKEKELEAQREDLVGKPETIREKIVEGRVLKRLNEIALLEQPYIRDDKVFLKDVVKQTIATLGENIKVRRFERYVLGEGLEKRSTDFAAEVAAQTAATTPVEPPKAEATAVSVEGASTVVVSPSLVKELRAQTGAGMMDCKKALVANDNDLEKAVDFLRKKGLASAEKKSSRIASEGLIGTYIHDGRIGILIEVNCETDFVARGDTFKDLVESLAMQAAAYPLVQVVSVTDVPADVVAKEKEIEAGKEDLANKPEAIRNKIVEGRVAKRLAELALLEQPFIKDDKKLVKDVVKEAVATLGENIQVRRFTRFNLGEGIAKKVVDFAGEVAAQTRL